MPSKNPIPEFVIDLNLRPEDRFYDFGCHYGTALIDLLNEVRGGFTSGIVEWVQNLNSFSTGLLHAGLGQWLPPRGNGGLYGTVIEWLDEKFSTRNLTGKTVDLVIDTALSVLHRSLREHEYMRELEGLAAATGADVNDLLLGNLIYDLSAGLKMPGIGCTGFVHGGPKHPLIARAMDWSFPEGIGGETLILRYQGGSGSNAYEILTVGFPGFNGLISGMSSEGVAMTVNQRTMDDAIIATPSWETPTLWRAREVLENSTDYASAYRMICRKSMASPAFFLLCGTEPGEACLVMSDGLYQEHVGVPEYTTQVVANHVPGEAGPPLDFDDATSQQRFDALYVRTQGMRSASIRTAKDALEEWPVHCERTVQQMILSPAENALYLRCQEIDPGYHLFRTL